MASEPQYTSHGALYGTTGGAAVDARSAHQGSRSFFIIDKSRMVGETDTVEGAKVVYLPETEFDKPLYQSRCSCLIGVADVYRNLTGEFPQSFTMAGCCYACKLLQPDYFMFLLGRPFEPVERVVASLQHISDIFHFYYRSPVAVLKKSQGDWETFTTNMTFVFTRINDYVFRDPHSVPFMFNTLHYTQSGTKRKRSRLFMLASRILRSCQQHKTIVGGYIMYNKEIVCTQLSPTLMEKLQVVGGGGIELNTKSILADNVAPETVWVVEVYLTPAEVKDLDDVRQDLHQYQLAYRDMTPNPALIDSTATSSSRYQSSSIAGSSSRSSHFRSVKRSSKSSTWRSHASSRAKEPVLSLPDDEDYYNLPQISDTKVLHDGGGTETDGQSFQGVVSDDMTVFNPINLTVAFFPRKNVRTSRQKLNPQISRVSTAGGRGKVREREEQRKRAVSKREMPQLHVQVEQRHTFDPQYADADEITDPEATLVDVACHPTQPIISTPLDNPPFSSDQSNLPPLPTIPVSLSIPITRNKRSDENSPRLSAAGSSVEEERFVTPSPGLHTPFTPQQTPSGETQSTPIPVLESSSCADQSNSYQTADDQSNSSHSLSPSEQQSLSNRDMEKLEPGVTSMPLPVKPPTFASRQSHLKQTRYELEDSGDFMDSEALDQLIAQTQLEREFGALQMQSHLVEERREGASVDGGDQENENLHMKSSPLPAPPLPPRHSSSPRTPPLLPQLPASDSQLATNASLKTDNFKLPLSDSLRQAELVGNSGEFTVMPTISPPIPPRKQATESGVEHTSEVDTPPPSPPPRTHSRRRKLDSPQFASTETSSKNSEVVQELVVDEDVPPSPPPRQRHEFVTADKDGNLTDGLLVRSDSSSPEYQHRDLTQREGRGAGSVEREEEEKLDLGEVQGNEEGWESGGEMEGQEWGETVGESDEGKSGEGEKNNQERKTDSRRIRRSSTCVDPVEEEGRVLEDSTDEVTSATSTVKTLTSDEESDEDTDVTVKTATLRYRANTHDKVDLQEVGASLHVEDSTESILDRIPGPHFSDTPSVASLSLTQLNTPETTLHYSIMNEMQNSAGGLMTDSESVLVDSAVELPGSENVARSRAATRIGSGVTQGQSWLRQTLGRQTQPSAVKPIPDLETWCLYVQRQFNTVIVLVAKAGLQKDHTLITNTWKMLLPQLFALDQGCEGLEERAHSRGSYNLAVYHNADKFCAVECPKALYRFRHAIRFTHLEYQKNPDLCQVSLLHNAAAAAGACKMVSQKVMGRETFYHHQRSLAPDVFNATAQVSRNARQTTHPLLSGDTPAQFL